MPVGMFCGVLASDRGPSCAKMSHLPNLKPIHIRFVKGASSSGMSLFDEDEDQCQMIISVIVYNQHQYYQNFWHLDLLNSQHENHKLY